MTAPQDRNAGPGKGSQLAEEPDLSRRRFARGGFTATALLGSLPSTPVLGQNVFYNCTLSGQLSGNVSYRVRGDCSTLGYSPSYWRTATSWPGYTKGTLPNGEGSNICTYVANKDGFQGTLFKDSTAVGIDALFAYPIQVTGGWQCPTTIDSSANHKVSATMLQALYLDNGGTDALNLCAAIVATLLNIKQNPTTHVLSVAQVQDMFMQVYSSGSFSGMYVYDTGFGTVKMDRAQLIGYLRTLYKP